MEKPRKIKGIIFDWGGTLSHWADADMEALWKESAYLIAYALKLEPKKYHKDLVKADTFMWNNFLEGMCSFDVQDIIYCSLAPYKVAIEKDLLQDAVDIHLQKWVPLIEHKHDAKYTLHELCKLGIKCGLLSNTPWPKDFHDKLLEKDKLLEHLDVRVYSSHHKHMKPHPEIFQETLYFMDLRAKNVLFVGDRQLEDIYGAQRQKMRGVWVKGEHSVASPEIVPDFEITQLIQLLDIVKENNEA